MDKASVCVYVCVSETDNGREVVKVLLYKDAAWEWVRECYQTYIAENPDQKEYMNWTNDGNEHSCWNENLPFGWYTYEMPVEV